MANISNLPRDLTEEVLSRLPITSVRGAQFTCKKWNALFKDRSFTKKYFVTANKLKNMKEIQVVMMLENRVYLMSVNLCNPSIERIGKLISLEDSDRVDISTIFHCGGLMLCIPKDKSRLVVWNPYSGQTRWIEPRNSYHKWDMYALGYEKKIYNNKPCRIHKLLRFAHDGYSPSEKDQICEFEIYNLNSDSWKVVDVSPDWTIGFHQRGLTLDGNTYWFAQDIIPPYVEREISHLPCFLLCFDFSTERFGPRLPLPFNAFFQDTVTLSSVGENQLAVLFQRCESDGDFVKIWISTKIEPNAVSWSKFLKVDMEPLTGFQFCPNAGSFFVHKKKKFAVILDKERKKFPNTCNIAYIIGKRGYFKKVYLGETRDPYCWPLVCSYVPSLF